VNRFFWMLLLAGLVPMWFWVPGLYHKIADRQVTSLPVAQYAAARPWTKWVELTDCYVNTQDGIDLESVMTRQGVRVSSVTRRKYAPVWNDEKRGGSVVVLVECDGSELKDPQWTNVPLEPGSRWMAAETRHIRGLIRYGINDDGDVRKLLRESNRYPLDPDFVILNPRQDGSDDDQWMFLFVTLGFWVVLGIVAYLAFR
jgi:hypothetical protein